MDTANPPYNDDLPQWLVAGETFTDEVLLEASVTPSQVPRRDMSRYEVIGALGSGASGEVLLALDRDIGRKVAIKRYTDSADSRQSKARFLREVRTLGELEHPHIVPIHDVGRDDEGYFFVMRLVEGETLKEVIRRLRNGDPEAHARYTFAVRAQIALAVVHAVAYAHEKGIVHRDIKPANVMIGTHGEVQLVDWGIATKVGQSGAVVGSPAYMAPEQAVGASADVRSDVYALGVMLHELLSLEHYLQHVASVSDLLQAVQVTPVSFARDLHSAHQDAVPAEFAWVIARATRKAMDDRYATADAFALDLQRALDGDFDCLCPITWQKWALGKLKHTVERRPLALPAMFGLNLIALGGLAGAVGWMSMV